MLSFSPGELSTIAGPLFNVPSSRGQGVGRESKQFNFHDLPCPPQSVMVYFLAQYIV